MNCVPALGKHRDPILLSVLRSSETRFRRLLVLLLAAIFGIKYVSLTPAYGDDERLFSR